MYKGNEVLYNTVKVKGKNTSITETDAFVKSYLPIIHDQDKGNSMLYSISYKLADGRWYNSKWYNEEKEFFSPDLTQYGLDNDDMTVSEILIRRVENVPNPEGGTDEHNDCLYYAIKFALGDDYLKFLPQNPYVMKKWLRGLKIEGEGEKMKVAKRLENDESDEEWRDRPIHYGFLKEILEDKLKCCVNVKGDYLYESKKKYPRKIVVELNNGHYKYQNNQAVRKELVKWKAHEKNYVLFVEREDCYLTYNGEYLLENWDLSHADLNTSKTCIYKQFKAMERGNCSVENKKRMKELKRLGNMAEYQELEGECMREYYHNFMSESEKLKDITGGQIDLKQHGYDINNCILTEFWKRAKTYEFQPIDEEETKWLEGTNRYGLLYSQNGISGKFNCYDVNSYYPHLMKNPKLLIPYGEPSYQVINEVPDIVRLGIYRARIGGVSPTTTTSQTPTSSGIDRRLFLPNSRNYYTNEDIKRAIQLNYKVEMIMDGKPNFCHYETHIKAHYLFAEYVDYFYQFKSQTPLAKVMLNKLWGLLCEKVKVKETTTSQTAQKIDIGNSINDLENWNAFPRNMEGMKHIMTKKFKRPHARIGSFLTAYGRTELSKLIEPYVDTVVQVKTDGFYTTKTDIPVSKELGKLKLEKSGYFKINSLNNIEETEMELIVDEIEGTVAPSNSPTTKIEDEQLEPKLGKIDLKKDSKAPSQTPKMTKPAQQQPPAKMNRPQAELKTEAKTNSKESLTRDDDEYKEWKADFEKGNFMVRAPYAYHQQLTDATGTIRYESYSRKDFRELNSHHGECLQLWFDDEKRRSYNYKLFVPFTKKNVCPPNIYNTFEGFKYNTVLYELKAGVSPPDRLQAELVSTEWFHEYLRTLANDDEKVYKFLLWYIADIVQNPNKSPHISIVLKGLMGVGKDTLTRIIEALIGVQYVLATDTFDDLFGKFNSSLKDKIVVSMEEAKWTSANAVQNQLKSFITCEKIGIEVKYLSKFEVDNIIRLIISSNDDSPVPIPVGNRRFVVILCGTKYKGNDNYWKAKYASISDEKTMNALYHELKNIKIPDGWNLVSNIPITKEQYNQEKSNIHPIWSFLKETFDENSPGYCKKTLDDMFSQTKDGMFEITNTDFQRYFLDYCKDENSFINEKNFKPATDIAGKLRGAEGYSTTRKRILINGNDKAERFTVMIFDRKVLLEHIHKCNYCADLLEERVLQQGVCYAGVSPPDRLQAELGIEPT